MNAMYKTNSISSKVGTAGVVDAHGDNINVGMESKTTVALMEDVMAARAAAADTVRGVKTIPTFKFNF